MIALLWLIGYYAFGLLSIGFYVGRYESNEWFSLNEYLLLALVWPIILIILLCRSISDFGNVTPYLRRLFGKRVVK